MISLFLQVRLDSKRLPNKALLEIKNIPLISHVMKNLRKINADNYVLVTCSDCYETLKPLALNEGFEIFSGSKENVLNRFYEASVKFKSTTIIRATGDNPFVSEDLAQITLDSFNKNKLDYCVVKNIPHGSSVEVIRATALSEANFANTTPFEKEHVCPYLYNNEEKFKIAFIEPPQKYKSNLSVTVDTQADFNFAKNIIESNDQISLDKIIEKYSVVYIPQTKINGGTGHYRRICELQDATSIGSIYINSKQANIDFDRPVIDFIPPRVDKVVFDNFKTTKEILSRINDDAIIVGIDEGSRNLSSFDVLIDTLPRIKNRTKNISHSDFGYLKKSNYIKKNISEVNKVLIVFGGEGNSKLDKRANNYYTNKNCEVVIINKANQVDNLFIYMRDFDLVITHFGLTALEAAFQNIPVITLNPTNYHKRLAKSVGLPTQLSIDLIKIYKSISNFSNIEALSLKDPIFTSITGPEKNGSKIVLREKNRTYYIDNYGIIFQKVFKNIENSYTKEYFNEEYKNQYGKTYLEDFEKIEEFSKKRVSVLKEYSKGDSLLDIGCAYGPFLKAASDAGYDATGIDICEDAVNYVKNSLNIEASVRDFSQHTLHCKYDVITMWFVIEHFDNINKIIEKVYDSLNNDGIYAFSTPNSKGISARKSFKNFLRNSPLDHYYIFNANSISKILRIKGFEVVKVINTGHHIERFPLYKDNLIVNYIYSKISKIFKLGDTFELYCRKVSK